MLCFSLLLSSLRFTDVAHILREKTGFMLYLPAGADAHGNKKRKDREEYLGSFLFILLILVWILLILLHAGLSLLHGLLGLLDLLLCLLKLLVLLSACLLLRLLHLLLCLL